MAPFPRWMRSHTCTSRCAHAYTHTFPSRRERHVCETDTIETDSLGYHIAGIDRTNKKTDRQTDREDETEGQRDRETERRRQRESETTERQRERAQ